MNLKPYLLRFWNLWPPLLFSGIKIQHISPDYRLIKVKLKLRFWNANYVGTAFGGSIFAMTDAFFMVMLLKNLGHDYIVWDKAASIKYLKPGKTDLYVQYRLTQEEVNEIRAILENQDKMDWERQVAVHDENGEQIANVTRVLYIRKKTENNFRPDPSRMLPM